MRPITLLLSTLTVFLLLLVSTPAHAECQPSTTCNGNGTCSATGACVCNPGFAGAACNQCAANYFGYPDCKFCSAAATCNGNGTCGSSGDCVCNTGFAGAGCNQCAANYFGYPDCKLCSAATTCNGNGTCSGSGACVCNTGFAGAACNQCAAGYSGYPNCVPAALPPPVISTVSPDVSTTTGGIKVVISGKNFGAQGKVTIGSQACAILQYNATNVVCSAPPGQGKDLPLVLQQSGMDSNIARFSYQPPDISAINPSSGPQAGGYPLTITGSNFGIKGTVTVGGKVCGLASYSHTKITCTVPPGSGVKQAVVVSAGGQNSDSVGFDYLAK